jgi:hypothetical protein
MHKQQGISWLCRLCSCGCVALTTVWNPTDGFTVECFHLNATCLCPLHCWMSKDSAWFVPHDSLKQSQWQKALGALRTHTKNKASDSYIMIAPFPPPPRAPNSLSHTLGCNSERPFVLHDINNSAECALWVLCSLQLYNYQGYSLHLLEITTFQLLSNKANLDNKENVLLRSENTLSTRSEFLVLWPASPPLKFICCTWRTFAAKLITLRT